MLHNLVARQKAAEQLAHSEAARLEAEADAQRDIAERGDATVRTARRTLINISSVRPMTSSAAAAMSQQQRKEAIRETARDCVRREQKERLERMAASASQLAARQEEAVARVQEWEREELGVRAKMHESWVQRKLEYEDLRSSRALGFASDREEEKRRNEAKRQAEEGRMIESSQQRAREREQRLLEKKAKSERLELEKEQADERRRKGRAELQANLAANRAERLAADSEVVWLQAQSQASKYRDDLSRRQQVAATLVGELDDDRKATAGELGRLARRLEMAERKEAAAKAAFEERSASAAELAQHRKLWFTADR